ncbi:PAS domain-containing hybrid sensor histidine kinase/response regulator [Telluria aromaticivorans]|uniref:histidine kinase n=1 Tax=Telluria aromaticivorans TaxID=2725995 RepID=A0A7Y2K1S4_9BURK|nr:PAS domain-containing protein [Telluria aromaticivorans]NNG24981.1 PAS domain-containing protein [Telluria aromaticivorans]
MQHRSTPAPTIDPAALGLHLFEASPDCVKLLDAEGRVVAMNRNGQRAMDIADLTPLVGSVWATLWPAASHAEIDAAIAAARSIGNGSFRGACPTAAGTPKWWDVTISAVGAPSDGLLVVSRDITARVQADAERERLLRQLRAANDRMEDVFRQAPAFMCVLSGPDHVFEMINERYLELVGGRDPVGVPLREALPEIAGQGFIEMFDRVYRTGEPFTGTDVPVMLRRRPGAPLERRFVDQVYLPLRDAEGRVTGILVHGVDQTERKLAEIELYESRERFEKIVSQAATGVVQMDPEGRITLVNQKYCHMVGRSEADLLGTSVFDVTAPDSLPVTFEAVRRLAEGEAGVIVDKQYLRPDGSLMPATSSVNALRGPDGEFQGLVAIVVDTTESKRAAEKLRASEERYRTLFESVDQGFCIFEMIFDEQERPIDYRFLEMNKMFEAHTGLHDAVGKTAKEMLPTLDSFWFETYGRVALTGEPVRFENEAPAMSRWFDVYATRIGAPGNYKVALLFSDITTRKQSEDTLRKLAADLAEMDRRKTEFLATLAHELRNPLAPIRSGLSVMRLKGDNPATVARVREMMERQVSHMVHLIDDLLDIARISGGKLELKKERADLRAVLSSAIETSLPLIESGRHELSVNLPEAPVMADVDITRIAQVVANLLNNAAKYTPAGGRIGLSMEVDDWEAVIAVSDNGIGIPQDSLSSVFEMFSQIGQHTDRSQGGLGIGLSLVRRLVDMHGGWVSAAGRGLQAGSVFTVRLPLAALDEAGLAADNAHAGTTGAAGEGMKILVVDDNVDAAVTLSMILEACGYTAQVAHDGAGAVEVARTFRPQVAFLDIGMPGMDGYDTARAMRQVAGLEGMTLVALTGWGADSDRQKSNEAGFDHHLTKPVQLATVQELLGQIAA